MEGESRREVAVGSFPEAAFIDQQRDIFVESPGRIWAYFFPRHLRGRRRNVGRLFVEAADALFPPRRQVLQVLFWSMFILMRCFVVKFEF